MSKNIISKKQVKHIAKLAKIKLSKEEIKKYQKELGDIISYFEKLNEVDTKGVEIMGQSTGLKNKIRKDDAKEFLSQENALKNAPKKEGSYFKTLSPLDKDE